MKHTFGLVSILSISLLVLNSCDLIKDLTYNVNPNPLVLQGDSIKFTVDVNVPEKGLKKKVKADISAKLGATSLGTWTIQGEKVTGNGKTITFKPGGTATFEMALPYDASLENADLTISGKVYKGKKEKAKEAIPETKIADATIVTQNLVNNTFKVLTLKDAFKRNIDIDANGENSVVAKINFNKGKFDVKSSELKDQDMVDLVTWIKTNIENPKIKINSIQINGYASPDGEESKNEDLSHNRSISARKELMKIFKKEKIEVLADTTLYAVSKFGEDFEGFKAQLAKTTTISEGDKALFIRILDMQKDPAQREKEMVNLGKSYTALEKDVFPAIRRSSIIVNYTKLGKTDEEMLAEATNSLDSLSLEEALFATGNLINDLNQKIAVLENASKRFEDNRVFNNLGAAYFVVGKLPEAEAAFKKSSELSATAQSNNNQAAVAIKDMDRSNARSLVEKALSAADASDKDAVSYNVAILDIMDGEYSKAAKGLTENSFNKALNACLMNKLDEAGTILSDLSEDAMNHYLMAVVSARKGAEVGEVVSSLKKALALAPELKNKAANDREFLKFFEDTTFGELFQ